MLDSRFACCVDRVFSESGMKGIAAMLLRSDWLVFVSYRTKESWGNHGLRLLQVGGLHRLSTTGREVRVRPRPSLVP